MSFTGYTLCRRVYIFPKSVPYTCRSPSIPWILYAFSSRLQLSKSWEENAFHVCIYFWRIDRRGGRYGTWSAHKGISTRDRRRREWRAHTYGTCTSVCVLLRQQIWPESEIDLSDRLPWTASSTLREEFNLERNWVIKRAPRLPSIPLSHHPFAQRYDNLRKFIRIETCLASNRSKRRHSSTMNCWEAAIYDYNKDKLLITNQFIGSSNFIVVPAPVVITSG